MTIKLPNIISNELEQYMRVVRPTNSPRSILNNLNESKGIYPKLYDYLFSGDIIVRQLNFIQAFYSKDFEFITPKYNYAVSTGQFIGINNDTGYYIMMSRDPMEATPYPLRFALSQEDLDNSPFDQAQLTRTEVVNGEV